MTKPELMTLLNCITHMIEEEARLIKILDCRLTLMEQLSLHVAKTLDKKTEGNDADDIAASIVNYIHESQTLAEKLKSTDISDILDGLQEDSTDE